MQLAKLILLSTKIFFALLIISFFQNCSKDNRAINLPPSLQKLTEQTDCNCIPFIDEYSLNGNTIYVYSCNGPGCYCIKLYYNTDGEEFQPKSDDHTDFVKHIWTCKK